MGGVGRNVWAEWVGMCEWSGFGMRGWSGKGRVGGLGVIGCMTVKPRTYQQPSNLLDF